VYRYALPLELLSFIIIAVLLSDMLGHKRAVLVLGILALLIIPTTQRIGIGRLAWGSGPYVQIRLPDRPKVHDNAIVLIVGANAGTYFVPAFPTSVRFLGIDVVDTWPAHTGEFRGPPVPESMLEPFPSLMHKILNNYHGQVLLVFLANDRDRVEPALHSYHYRLKTSSCGVIRSNIAAVPPLQLCELEPS
jgi:MFS superfamily sulfate permease-like transporter